MDVDEPLVIGAHGAPACPSAELLLINTHRSTEQRATFDRATGEMRGGKPGWDRGGDNARPEFRLQCTPPRLPR